MRQSDFLIAAARPLAPTQATAPAVSSNPGTPATAPAFSSNGSSGAGFGAMFRQVQGEVGDFLANGGSDLAPAPTLSPEGQAYLERTQNAAPAAGSEGVSDAGQQEFLESIKPWAQQAADMLGVDPALVAAHAALESGWGQRPLKRSNGADSNNLFGVKAGAQWRGDVAATLTTEYENGAALKKTERFRSYPDQGSAFRDYAQVLLDNPRFHGALNTGNNAHAFAQGLARGGYATDPAYAEKLSRLASRLQQSAAASGD
jgi:flagellar protein FlgJ